MHAFPKGVMHMHKLILASCAGSSLVVTITIIVDTSAQVSGLAQRSLATEHLYVDTNE